MRSLQELISTSDPAMPLVQQWVAESRRPVQVLPASSQADEVLLGLQVTTRSPMGAIAHETGGILIDDGWLRILGSGHERLPRNLRDWNQGRASGFLLVADDALGGFFAINGGGLGDDPGSLYYLAPDTLEWEALEVGYSDFVQWALSERITDFYEYMRWASWQQDVQALAPDQGFGFYPFLWTKEGSPETSDRRPLPMSEIYAFNLEQQQLLG
ncbi:DUF2625 domain-containing protein [Comamonas testosteroni]|uniref:DUF2625 domain-containing protein n=1 Tax=Comamonas testosteroni TaxID=285 RepID=A0A373F7Y8_COMTE|nr:DUF2625 domain-containing protein [Comamonas testosteroni]RGE40256.1 DUF2625 domain-containing protein [Comamonas testosteroni]